MQVKTIRIWEYETAETCIEETGALLHTGVGDGYSEKLHRI